MDYGTLDIFVFYGYHFDLVEGRAYDVDTLFTSFISRSSRLILAIFFFFFFLFFLLVAGLYRS